LKEHNNERIEKLRAHARAYELVLKHQTFASGARHEPNWKQLLEGLTRREQLKAIARHTGGTVKVREARDILYNNDFIKSKNASNAYTVVQLTLSAMVEDGTFERSEPGKYKLVGAQEVLPLP
jgi:HD superfamily phosphohydrolase YqeK